MVPILALYVEVGDIDMSAMLIFLCIFGCGTIFGIAISFLVWIVSTTIADGKYIRQYRERFRDFQDPNDMDD